MELSHLRYLLSVAEEGNFARAARRLAVDPSTLYRRLHDLELDLGAPLFDRGDGEVRLSAAGGAFVAHARRIVDEAARIAEDMSSLAKGHRGVVRIGLNGVAAELPEISAALNRAREDLDDLDIRLSVMPSELQMALLRSDALDLGMAYGRAAWDDSIGFVHLQRQRFVLAVARDHPLALADASPRLGDLAGEAFIFQRRESAGSVHDRLIAACSAAGLVPDIRHTIIDEDTQLAMVAAGMGVTLTLEGAAARRWRGQVEFRAVADFDMTVDLDLMWHAGAVSPGARRVADAINAALSAHRG